MISYCSQIKCEKLRYCLNSSVITLLVHSLLNSSWTLWVDFPISVILKAKIKRANKSIEENNLNKGFYSVSG